VQVQSLFIDVGEEHPLTNRNYNTNRFLDNSCYHYETWLKNQNIHLNSELSIFNSNVKTVLLYGAETWRGTKRLDQRLQVLANTRLTQILQKDDLHRISDESYWAKSGQQPVTNSFLQKLWRWIGHTLCRQQHTIARQSLSYPLPF